MTKNKFFIFFLLILFGFLIYHFPNDNNKPILTLFSSESTTVHKIEFYKNYAIYKSTIGGAKGEIEQANEKIKYNRNLNFGQIKNEIYNLSTYPNTYSDKHSIIIFIDDLQILTSEKIEVVQKLLNAVDKTCINPLSHILGN